MEETTSGLSSNPHTPNNTLNRPELIQRIASWIYIQEQKNTVPSLNYKFYTTQLFFFLFYNKQI